MSRTVLESDLRKAVTRRDSDCCTVCGFRVPGALTVHHRTPVEFGGTDVLKNLAVLCTRCHSLAHFFGAEPSRFQSHGKHLRGFYTAAAVRRLRNLAKSIAAARRRTHANNRVVPGAVSLAEAVNRISRRHNFSAEREQTLRKVLDRVVKKIPRAVRRTLSYRLVRGNKFLSISSTNYLVFRTPAYDDHGERFHFDAWIMWPLGTRRTKKERRGFARFACINIGVEYSEILNFTRSDWAEFKTACLKAATAPPGPQRSSNIVLSAA